MTISEIHAPDKFGTPQEYSPTTEVEKKMRSLDWDAGTHFSVVTFVWIQLRETKATHESALQ